MVLEDRLSRRSQRGAAPVEHFLRRAVVPRRASRRSLKAALRWASAVVGLAGLIAAGFWTATAAGRAPELAVSRIRVEGNNRLAEGEILEALGLHPGSNILSLDLEALKQQLLRSPWVKDVQLTRVLPATLTLRVQEREPMGVAVLDGLYLIDAEGTFLDEIGPRYADLALPLVRGLADDEGRLLTGRPEMAGRVLTALARDERLESAVSEIDVSEGADSLLIQLRRPHFAILLREEDLLARLTEILPLTEEILRRFPSLEAVDLRFRGRVYLRLYAEHPAEGETATAPGEFGGEVSILNKRDRYIVGLDIGTTKVTAIVSEITEEGRLDIIGIGSTESKGLRKGMVINLEQTVDSIKRVVEEAELMAGVEIESAYVGLAGGHIKGFNSRAVVAITNKNREINREDVFRAIDAAKAIPLPADREIVHVLPQEFVVDGQDGIFDPTGMTGSRLEANVHIITAGTTATQNIVTCVNRAGLEVTETVLEQLSAAEAVLTPDEKELGVALVDIGGGTTDIAIFDKGTIWHTAVLPTGGDHFTNDLAVGLRTPIFEAEKIKKKYGCALGTMVSEEDTIEVPSVGGRNPRILLRQILAEILQPRAEEICHFVYEEIRRAGYESVLNSGVVLTGGSASLEGLPEVAERIFDMPIRCGSPSGVGGLADVVATPSYATGVGLVLYAHRSRSNRLMPHGRFSHNPLARIWERCRKLMATPLSAS